MKTLLKVLLAALLALVLLKVLGAILGIFLPLLLVLGILGIPVGFVILVGWGVMTLVGGARRHPA